MQFLEYCRFLIGQVSSIFIPKDSADVCMYTDPQLNSTRIILA